MVKTLSLTRWSCRAALGSRVAQDKKVTIADFAGTWNIEVDEPPDRARDRAAGSQQGHRAR